MRAMNRGEYNSYVHSDATSDERMISQRIGGCFHDESGSEPQDHY